MEVLCVGQCPQIIEEAIRDSMPKGVHIQTCANIPEAMKSFARDIYDICLMLDNNSLSMLEVIHPPCTILFSPKAEQLEVKSRAAALGVDKIYSKASDLGNLVNYLSEMTH